MYLHQWKACAHNEINMWVYKYKTCVYWFQTTLFQLVNPAISGSRFSGLNVRLRNQAYRCWFYHRNMPIITYLVYCIFYMVYYILYIQVCDFSFWRKCLLGKSSCNWIQREFFVGDQIGSIFQYNLFYNEVRYFVHGKVKWVENKSSLILMLISAVIHLLRP